MIVDTVALIYTRGDFASIVTIETKLVSLRDKSKTVTDIEDVELNVLDACVVIEIEEPFNPVISFTPHNALAVGST